MAEELSLVPPRVSVGLPVYNGGQYLRASIEGVLAQEFTDFELIISDNCSTDTTEAIARSYELQDPRIRYFRNDANVGAVGNFDLALRRARGEYFVWLGADDVWAPSFLRQMAGVLDAEPDAVLAFCRVAAINRDGEPMPRCTYTKVKPPSKIRILRLLQLIWWSEAYGKACFIYGLIRTDAIRSIDLLRDYGGTTWGVDNRLVFQLAKLGQFGWRDDVGMYKRVHSDSQSQNEGEVLLFGFINADQLAYFNGWREAFVDERPLARLALETIRSLKVLGWFTWHLMLRKRNVAYVFNRTLARLGDRFYEMLPSFIIKAYRAVKRSGAGGRGSN